MSVKALLCLTVERERGNGALQAWGDHAPQALRATPTCEFLVFSPDHVTFHRTHLYSCNSAEREISARREELQRMRGRARHELLPAAAPTLPRKGKAEKSLACVVRWNNGLRVVSLWILYLGLVSAARLWVGAVCPVSRTCLKRFSTSKDAVTEHPNSQGQPCENRKSL